MLNIIMDLDDTEKRRRAIRIFLKRNDLSVAGVCARAGMTPTTMYGYLTGKNNDIGYGTLERFARGAGTTIAVMLGEKGLSDPGMQTYEAMPEAVRRQLQPEDIEIIKKLPALDRSQKQMLSGMLKALPREHKPAIPKKPPDTRKEKT